MAGQPVDPGPPGHPQAPDTRASQPLVAPQHPGLLGVPNSGSAGPPFRPKALHALGETNPRAAQRSIPRPAGPSHRNILCPGGQDDPCPGGTTGTSLGPRVAVFSQRPRERPARFSFEDAPGCRRLLENSHHRQPAATRERLSGERGRRVASNPVVPGHRLLNSLLVRGVQSDLDAQFQPDSYKRRPSRERRGAGLLGPWLSSATLGPPPSHTGDGFPPQHWLPAACLRREAFPAPVELALIRAA